jgi:predicted amidohydrolase YtcJ
MIDSGDDGGHRQYRPASWSNWPMYADGDEIIVDVVVRYDRIVDELLPLFEELGIENVGALPRLKSGHRQHTDHTEGLTEGQIERIAELHRREIAAFGFTPPAPSVGA